jgi:hypothetical protein
MTAGIIEHFDITHDYIDRRASVSITLKDIAVTASVV